MASMIMSASTSLSPELADNISKGQYEARRQTVWRLEHRSDNYERKHFEWPEAMDKIDAI